MPLRTHGRPYSVKRRPGATPRKCAPDRRRTAGGEFAGWVDDIAACMAQLDLLLVPSAGQEATTRVILEAFAAGVPVIAFPSGGIPEVVVDGVTGLLANTSGGWPCVPWNSLPSSTRRLISIAQAARESWERRFTLERYHQEIL